MHICECVSQFIDISKAVACSIRDSDKYLLTSSSPDRVSPSITLITPIGPLLIYNRNCYVIHLHIEHVKKWCVKLTVQKVTRTKHCYCCNSEFDLCRFSCSIPYVTRYADSCFVYNYFMNWILLRVHISVYINYFIART